MEGRTYRGLGEAERRTLRRDRLVASAIALIGEVGFANATVRTICAHAGLTERYFYEHFKTRELILVASFEAVCEDIGARLLTAIDEARPATGPVRIQAAVSAYFGFIAEKRAAGRVLLVEGLQLGPEAQAWTASLNGLGDVLLHAIGGGLRERLSPRQSRALMASLVGALAFPAHQWLMEASPTSERETAELVGRTLVAIAAAA